MSLMRAGLLSLLGSVFLVGCNRDEKDPVTPSLSFAPEPEDPRGTLNIIANGGNSSGSAIGNGGGGGSIEALPKGNVFIGQNPAPNPPPLPATPVTGTEIGNWSNVRTHDSGNALINGNITAITNGSIATLNVTKGDLIINGSLNSPSSLLINVMAGTVFIHGTIKTGRVDGTDDGDEGGNVFIFALRIICTGTVDTRGEDNPAGVGGSGGSVNFCTDDDDDASGRGQTSQVYVGGNFLMNGGDGNGPAARGGTGGNFQTAQNRFDEKGDHFAGSADGSVHISGTEFNVNGGSATGTGNVRGGSSGFMYWMADSGFFFKGTVVGLGGSATSSDGEARGGSGTAIFVQEFTHSDSGPIAVFGSLSLSGGDATGPPTHKVSGGQAGFMYLINGTDMNFGLGSFSFRGGNSSGRAGEGGRVTITVHDGIRGDIFIDSAMDVSSGNGATEQLVANAGAFHFTTDLGDIQIAGSLALNGGSGSLSSAVSKGPSTGGSVVLKAGDGDANDAGSIILLGSIVANGGSDADDSDPTNGAVGGRVEMTCNNSTGSIYLDPGSSIQLDGGNAGGGGLGGFGGVVTLKTSGGSISAGTSGGRVSLRGSIIARGGTGGGRGGQVVVLSDNPTIPAVGGGDGRGGDITLHEGATIDLSGAAGTVGGEGMNNGGAGVGSSAAVIFDADGNNSNNSIENGIVRNLGLIVSRGAPANGDGGDINFDGLGAPFTLGPEPGVLDIQADGSGRNGEFRGD